MLGDQKHAFDVDTEEPLEIGELGFGDIADESDAGIIDQNVKVRNRGEHGAHLVFVGDVADVVGFLGIQVGDQDLGAGVREDADDLGANAGGAAGDESDFAVEAKGRARHPFSLVKNIMEH